jgi:hypothetical protein
MVGGGYSWVVAVENGAIQEGGVLAGGSGAALAPDNTNVLLSSTRMEALGLHLGNKYGKPGAKRPGFCPFSRTKICCNPLDMAVNP